MIGTLLKDVGTSTEEPVELGEHSFKEGIPHLPVSKMVSAALGPGGAGTLKFSVGTPI
jgi:hypothetical protein